MRQKWHTYNEDHEKEEGREGPPTLSRPSPKTTDQENIKPNPSLGAIGNPVNTKSQYSPFAEALFEQAASRVVLLRRDEARPGGSGEIIVRAIKELARVPEELRLEEARRRDLFARIAALKSPVERERAESKLAGLLGVSRKAIREELRLLSLPPQGPQQEDGEDAPRPEDGELFAYTLGPDILDRVVEAVHRLGVVGEERLIKLLYLSLTTRLLDHPVSVAVQSAASTGKNFVLKNTLRLFPPGAYTEWTGLSERALVYTKEDFRHRTIIIHEFGGVDNEMGNYLLRSLLSEGCLRYETVESTPWGLHPKVLEKEGPTNVIFTTTKVELHPENTTRLISVSTDDSPEQTARVLERAARGICDEVDTSGWQAFQAWLAAGPVEVEIPYAVELARAIPPKDTRLRRDIHNILSLIRAHALLHKIHRERNEEGKIIATLDDYDAVRDLYEPLLSSTLGASVRKSVRETVEAVKELMEEKEGRYVTTKELGEKLGLGRDATARRVRECRKLGYLQDEEGARRGRERHIVLGDPLPEDQDILPHPSALREVYTSLPDQFGNSEKYPEHGHLPGKTHEAKHSEKYRKNIGLSESGRDFSEPGIDFSEPKLGLNADFSEFPNHFGGDGVYTPSPDIEPEALHPEPCGCGVLSAKPHRITWRPACNTLVVEPAGGILPWQFVFSERIIREIPTLSPFHIAFVVDGRCWMTDDETFFRLAKKPETTATFSTTRAVGGSWGVQPKMPGRERDQNPLPEGDRAFWGLSCSRPGGSHGNSY